jgi:hypothetical protein
VPPTLHERPLYLIKRDISDYFASVNHDLLVNQTGGAGGTCDYLFRWNRGCGLPISTRHGATLLRSGYLSAAPARAFWHTYLTELSARMESLRDVAYFRYADNILLLSTECEAACAAATCPQETLSELRLTTKDSHEKNLLITATPASATRFVVAPEFRHLGLLFRRGRGRAFPRQTPQDSEPVPLRFSERTQTMAANR